MTLLTGKVDDELYDLLVGWIEMTCRKNLKAISQKVLNLSRFKDHPLNRPWRWVRVSAPKNGEFWFFDSVNSVIIIQEFGSKG